MSELTPVIRWSQNDDYVIINLEINQTKNDVYKITQNNITFSGVSNVETKYAINIQLFDEINSEESKYILEERVVKFVLKKIDDTKWVRITKDKNQYKSNIKINWDNFEDSDEDINNDSNFMNMPNMDEGLGNMDDMMKNMDPAYLENMMKSMNPGQLEEMMKSMNFNNDEDDNCEGDDCEDDNCEHDNCEHDNCQGDNCEGDEEEFKECNDE
jgi:prostaglandin-E synthase